MMPGASPRRRIAIGLALGAALTAGLGLWLLGSALSDEARVRAGRTGIVTLRALADVVERAGIAGDPVRRAVAGSSTATGAPRVIRVLAFEGLSLEASTDR